MITAEDLFSSKMSTDIGLSVDVSIFVLQTKFAYLMKFSSVRVITSDVKRLVRFYEQVTDMPVTQYTDDFAELHTPSATLAIGSTRTLQLFGGDSVAKAAQNQSAIIEFRVDDVDVEYGRLANFLGDSVVQKPTTMPWGIARYCFGTRMTI